MIVVFDTETNGLPKNFNSPFTDLNNWPRLVQIAWLVFDNQGNEIGAKDFIIKPVGYTIPREMTLIHNISQDFALKNGIDLKNVLEEFRVFIEKADLIVGHNLDFDEKVVSAEFLRIGGRNPFINRNKLCTKETSTNFCGIQNAYGFKWPTLKELYLKLFNKTYLEGHNAKNDVAITAQCFWELTRRKVKELVEVLGKFDLTKIIQEDQEDTEQKPPISLDINWVDGYIDSLLCCDNISQKQFKALKVKIEEFLDLIISDDNK